MEKRESNEQLKSLSFDMDEEIDDRNERRGRKAMSAFPHLPSRDRAADNIRNGKLCYCSLRERRMKASLKESNPLIKKAHNLSKLEDKNSNPTQQACKSSFKKTKNNIANRSLKTAARRIKSW
ncbi:hypothetical protein [Pseudomonas nitroreducens]|uniref:hypothetical protein n=1 Tax=Pseudomonas nitroreducens TaxID=46680 RepID=UPI002D80A35D|nr:hypothetical protein [Pseudomonas nitroreducens]